MTSENAETKLKFKAILHVPYIQKTACEIKAADSEKAKKAANFWARNIVREHRPDIKEHQWGFWMDTCPPSAPGEAYSAMQPIADGQLTIEYMEIVE